MHEIIIYVSQDTILDFEGAFGDADAVLTRLIEEGPYIGQWEIQGIFEHTPDDSLIEMHLKKVADTLQIPTPKIISHPMQNRDWLRECYQSFQPLTLGDFIIYGSHNTDPLPADKIPLKIDAATAFGSGEHATTKGCLQAMAELSSSPKSVLDIGCGSGILAMAYTKKTGIPVDATDIDPESVHQTHLNATENGLGDLIHVWQSNGYEKTTKTYDLILCNILAGPLINFAPDLNHHLNPKGIAILSGFLNSQYNDVLAAHVAQGLTLVQDYKIAEWGTMVLQKKEL